MREAVGQAFRHDGSELPPGGDIGLRHAQFTSGNDVVDHELLAILADDITLVNFVLFCCHLESDEPLFDFAIGKEDRADDKFDWLRRPDRAQVWPDMAAFSIDRVAS